MRRILVLTAALLTVMVGSAAASDWSESFNGPPTGHLSGWSARSGPAWNSDTCLDPSYAHRNGAGQLVLLIKRRSVVCAGQSRRYVGSEVVTGRTFAPPSTGRLYIGVRAHVPAAASGWFDIWLEGAARWPTGGEIDIAELRTGLRWAPGALVGNAELHGPMASGAAYGVAQRRLPFPVLGGWHTYWIKWGWNSVQIGVDTVAIAGFTPTSIRRFVPGARWPFNSPETLRLDFVTGGFGGPVTSATPAVTLALVDSVVTAHIR